MTCAHEWVEKPHYRECSACLLEEWEPEAEARYETGKMALFASGISGGAFQAMRLQLMQQCFPKLFEAP